MHPTYKKMIGRMLEKERAAKKKKCREPWFLYILRCCDRSLYTGITNNLKRRLKMHGAGKASKYTRTRRPVILCYQEKCATRTRALVRECEVKSFPKLKKEKLVASIE